MPAGERKHLDVIRPGKAAASATARPVIVGHGAMMKDPMLQADQKPAVNETQAPATEEEKPVIQRAKVVVRPLTDADKGEAQQARAEVEPATAESEIAPAAEGSQKDATEDEVSDQAVVDAVASQATVGKGQKKAQEEQARQEAIQKLIADKTYVVPISRPSNSRGKKLIALVCSLLVIVGAGLYLFIDAGVIGNGIKLPIDFIKQTSSVAVDNAVPVAQTPKPATSGVPSAASVAQKEYSSTVNGIAFSYPTDWTIAETKDDTRSGVTNVIVKSPMQEIVPANGVKSEQVSLVLTITIENTTSTTRYASNWSKLTFCSTETIALTKQTGQYYIAYVSKDPSKAISGFLLSQKPCDATAPTSASVSDQVQFMSKKNTYTVTGQYQYTDAYKKANPTAPATPAYTIETFRGAKQAVAIVQSLHEL